MTLTTEQRFDEIVDNFSKLDPILVLGDVGVDKYTYGDVSRISPEAPVPVLEVQKEWHKLGLAANVSDNLKELGVNSTLCGVIGEDRHASIFEQLLEEQGLKTWGIVRSEARPTTWKERVTTATQQICRIDYESSLSVDADSIEKMQSRIYDFRQNHSALIIEDYAKGLINAQTVAKAIKDFKSEGKLIAIDPSRNTDPNIYAGADLIKPNNIESELICKALGKAEPDVEKRIHFISEKLNIPKVIITLGAKGMAILDRDKSDHVSYIPTLASEVFDVSGAGDTAISAITSALVAGATLEEAAWIGNCASGVVVGKKGTAKVSVAELREFYLRVKAKNLA